ncbi:hypothetical protein ABVT39_020644 [Epinephelus coioides]
MGASRDRARKPDERTCPGALREKSEDGGVISSLAHSVSAHIISHTKAMPTNTDVFVRRKCPITLITFHAISAFTEDLEFVPQTVISDKRNGNAECGQSDLIMYEEM